LVYRLSPQWNAYVGLLGAIKITGNNTLQRSDWNNVIQKTNTTGYVHGFERFNYGLQLGFDRRLNKTWNLGLQSVLGLTDVSKNNVFGQELKQNNSQVNLIIGYRFK
jgi:hypothetical protein